MISAECMIEKELDVDDRYSVLAGIIQVDEVDNDIVLNEIRLDVAGRRGGKRDILPPQGSRLIKSIEHLFIILASSFLNFGANIAKIKRGFGP